ncbi:hypothetical protein GGS26DRAFT_540905 [Hypomontagnella submonticulosa]|nr:hypothetical protein GGS26DRAFT_540905 [Hypomontagnella submonticulosa]
MQLVGWSISETSFPLCSISYGALILFLMLLLPFFSLVRFLLFFRRRRQIPCSTYWSFIFFIFSVTFVSLRLSTSIEFVSIIHFPFPLLLPYIFSPPFPYCVM